jgi:glucose-6-phosphate 1-dehydrogenase
MHGDATFFTREDAVEAQWRVVDGVLGDVTPLHEYEPGSWGPAQTDALHLRDDRWHTPVATEPDEAPTRAAA